MTSITTDGIPLRERAEFWADLVSRHVTPIRIEPAGEQGLCGEIQTRVIGGLGVAQVAGVGVHASHTSSHIARARGHVYAACIHVDGEARIIRRGEAIALRPGDVFITDSRYEFALDLERRWRHLLITLPSRTLDSRVARPELLSGVVLRGHPLAQLWATHLATGFALAGELSPTAARLFARHSVDLLGQLLDESHRDHPMPSDASRAAIFMKACEMIRFKCSEPDLTPQQIAREIGVSSRALARVFRANRQTIMRRVFDERVRQAARLLTARQSAHRSVTDIAFACGFNDLSHFGRVFAAKIRMTPSEWRRRAR
jgi:AraC family transcriptional regulator, positive regulator of tynA and feaB